jgi:hypothetical protein
MVLAPIQVIASETPGIVLTIEKVTTASVMRTWSTLSLIYDNQFHDPLELDEEIENIHTTVPQLVDLEVIGESYEGRNITSLRITNEQNTVQKAKTLVVAQHHGREQITVELALRFMLHLLNNYGIDETITEYVDTQEIFIIPTINPDALEVVVNEGNHWLRKNLRPFDNDLDGFFSEDDVDDENGDGVISNFLVYLKDTPSDEPYYEAYDWEYWEGIDDDGDGQFNEDEVGLVDLNRNYATFWGAGYGSSDDVTTQVYHGTGPFSEPETQAFRDFVLDHRFAMSYSLHSGINTTYFPTNIFGNWVEGNLYYDMVTDFAGILPEDFNYDLSYTYQKLDAALSGGWGDWMYAERGTTVPITFEVYTNASAHGVEAHPIILENSTHIIREWKEIYGYFNPTEEYINTLWEELLPAFDYLLEMIPRLDISIPSVSGGVLSGENVTMSVQMNCLSPRLGSKEAVYVLDSVDVVMDSLISVGAGQTLTYQANIVLPSELSGSSFSIFIGNNYTGYYEFELSASAPSTQIDPLIISAVIGITIAAIVIVVYFVKYR